MGTGGTLPVDITQKVTFYNTTGFIERDKNIYFSPRTTHSLTTVTTGTTVSDYYRAELYATLNAVKNIPSEYSDIDISKWSPEDRTLRIKGVIDDFREVSLTGYALNYFIISRSIQYTNSTRKTYYGFFITGVRQSGAGTVELTYEPDHFTNVFYYNNLHQLTRYDLVTKDYDPFNENMKNCFIERQHYNRVKLVGGSLEPDNLDKLLNTKEQFNYRYQYRDSRTPISFNQGELNFTQGELDQIENNSDFNLLSASLRKKIITFCLGEVQIIGKNKLHSPVETVYDGRVTSGNPKNYDNGYLGYLDKGQILSGFPRYSILAWFIPDILEKYRTTIEQVKLEGELISNATDEILEFSSQTLRILTMETFSEIISSGEWGQQILSITPIKDSAICKGATISVSSLENKVTLSAVLPCRNRNTYPEAKSPVLKRGTKYAVFLNPKYGDRNNGYFYGELTKQLFMDDPDSIGQNIVVLNSLMPYLMFINSGLDNPEGTIKLPSEYPSETLLKTSYFEPVIEQEPYKFYSIQYNGNEELPLQKNRYYQSLLNGLYNIKVELLQTNTDALKLGFIPKYSVNEYESKYLNEGLVTTVASSIPFVSDAYASFYYQNKAQMKNQYAVAGIQSVASVIDSVISGVKLSQLYDSSEQGKVIGVAGVGTSVVSSVTGLATTALSQKAKLSDMAEKPDTIKQANSDIFYDLRSGLYGYSLSHYTIDNESYKSISKYLERYGYQIDLYDKLNTFDRVGWNFIKLKSFDYEATITTPQEDELRRMFSEGVTLVHNAIGLTTPYNYETILDR